jgi:hypothetical protein
MKNENGKFEDLIQLHKDKELTTFETLLIHELRVLNDSINGDHEETLVKKLTCIYGAIDDLESIEDLGVAIQKGLRNISTSILEK